MARWAPGHGTGWSRFWDDRYVRCDLLPTFCCCDFRCTVVVLTSLPAPSPPPPTHATSYLLKQQRRPSFALQFPTARSAAHAQPDDQRRFQTVHGIHPFFMPANRLADMYPMYKRGIVRGSASQTQASDLTAGSRVAVSSSLFFLRQSGILGPQKFCASPIGPEREPGCGGPALDVPIGAANLNREDCLVLCKSEMLLVHGAAPPTCTPRQTAGRPWVLFFHSVKGHRKIMTVYLICEHLVCLYFGRAEFVARRVCPVSGENSLDSVYNRREEKRGGGGCRRQVKGGGGGKRAAGGGCASSAESAISVHEGRHLMTLKESEGSIPSRIHGSAEDDCSGQALSQWHNGGRWPPFQRNTNDAEDATKKAAGTSNGAPLDCFWAQFAYIPH